MDVLGHYCYADCLPERESIRPLLRQKSVPLVTVSFANSYCIKIRQFAAAYKAGKMIYSALP